MWIRNSLAQNDFVVPAPLLNSRQGYNALDVNSINCININSSDLPEISRSLLSSAFVGPAFTLKVSFSVNALIASRCIRSTSGNSELHSKRKGNNIAGII